MPQPSIHATRLLYDTYHAPVYVQRDLRTYDHFASAHARTMRQQELLTTYMSRMLHALQEDLNTRGDCWLLRAIVQHELPAIHLLDHSAIACVYAMIFTPEEALQPDSRSIPYTSTFSRSPGGMLYTDHRARSFILDLRSDDVLHLICHALLMYAASKARDNDVQRLTSEKNALASHITLLSDRILGLERELALLRSAQPTGEAAADALPIPEPPVEAPEEVPPASMTHTEM